MTIAENLELPRLSVITAEEMPAITQEAFEIAHHLAEQGYSFFSGRNEYRKFNAELTEKSIALEAVCGLASMRRQGLPLESATFRVIDTTDNSMMSLALWRSSAKVVSLDDAFSQTVLDYFPGYVNVS